MALLHADNFSIYGTNPAFMLNGIYTENSSCTLVTDPDGVSSGEVLAVTSNFAIQGARFPLPSSQPTVGQACRLWMPVLPNNPTITPYAYWADVNNTPITAWGVDTTGRIFVTDGSARTGNHGTIATTTGPVVGANAWWHIEALMSVTSVTPPFTLTYEIRVEGVTVLSGTHTVTTGGPFAQVEIGADNFNNQLWYFKDYCVYDGTGSHNNTFLGSVIVKNLTVTSDVSLNWTPSTGSTGFPILSDIPPDDTKFISAGIGPIPPAYKGALSDLPATTTSVKGVITFVRAAKQDGGDGSLQNGVVSGASTGLGANRPITTAQTYWRDVFEIDPNTGNSWLPAAVNAANIQINRTT